MHFPHIAWENLVKHNKLSWKKHSRDEGIFYVLERNNIRIIIKRSLQKWKQQWVMIVYVNKQYYMTVSSDKFLNLNKTGKSIMIGLLYHLHGAYAHEES